MFRPLLLGHHQVTSMNFEEAVQCKSKISYINLKFNDISLSFSRLQEL